MTNNHAILGQESYNFNIENSFYIFDAPQHTSYMKWKEAFEFRSIKIAIRMNCKYVLG